MRLALPRSVGHVRDLAACALCNPVFSRSRRFTPPRCYGFLPAQTLAARDPLRADTSPVMPLAMTQVNRPISAYLRENVHHTFSGFNCTPTFLDLMLQVGVDRIMFLNGPPLRFDGGRTHILRQTARQQR
jgi:hypothetical protein